MENNREFIISLIYDIPGIHSQIADLSLDSIDNNEELYEVVIPILLKMTDSIDPNTKAGVLHALGNIGPAAMDAIPDIIRAVDDEDGFVRKNAIVSLCKIGLVSDKLLPILKKALCDKQPDVQAAALEYLSHYYTYDDSIISILIKHIRNVDYEVRQSAAKGLGECSYSSDRVVSALITALDDTDWRVRLDTISALAKLGKFAKKCLPKLINILYSANEEIERKFVFAAIYAIGPDHIVADAILDYLTTYGIDDLWFDIVIDIVRDHGNKTAKCVSYLCNILEGEIDGISINEYGISIILAIAEVGPMALPAISTLKKLDNNEKLAHFVNYAMYRLDEEKGANLVQMIKHLESTDIVKKRAIGNCMFYMDNLPSQGIEALKDLLEEKDEGVRFIAATALIKQGYHAKEVIALLLRKYKDGWSGYESTIALGEIGESAKEVLPILERMQDEFREVDICSTLGMKYRKALYEVIEKIKSED